MTRRIAVEWSATGDPLTPWTAKVVSQTWIVRANNFPERQLYTLLVDGEESGSFDHWPSAWQKVERRSPVPAKVG